MNLGLFIRGQGLIIDYAESAATIVTSGDSGMCVWGALHVCVCVLLFVCVCVCMFAPSKSNYHWKVAALLANAKCFVLLCSRLIGWLKYKTPTNAFLCCNLCERMYVFIRVTVPPPVFIRKEQVFMLKPRQAVQEAMIRINPVIVIVSAGYVDIILNKITIWDPGLCKN